MSFRHSLPLLLGQATAKISPGFDAAFWRYLRLPKAIHLWHSSGKTRSGETGTLISAGIEPRADYFPTLFFESDYVSKPLGAVSARRLRSRIEELRPSVDLVAMRLDRIQARLLFDRSYIRVPEWIRSSLQVPAEVQSLASGHNSLRQDLRLIRKHGFTVATSSDEEAFECFYQGMYVPHGRGRHGPDAHLRSRSILHASFRSGVLLLVQQEGETIAGLVIEKRRSEVNFAGIGVRGGEERLLKMGALSAAYYFGLCHARQNGFAKVDLGGTRPCCTDSLLRYKKKWGATIEARSINTNDYILDWSVTNPAIAALLEKYPLIVRDGSALSALTVSENGSPAFALPTGLLRKIEVRPGTSLQWPLR